MTTMDAVTEVQAALTSVAKKSKSAEGYSYRGIDDVVRALHPLLSEHGLVIYPEAQEILSWETEVPGRKSAWSRLVLLITYRVRGTDDEGFTMQAVGVGLDNGDKGSGKALSYAYKSVVSQLFSLPTDDPKIDAEMTPDDPTWWGGWDSTEEHNQARQALLDRTMQFKRDESPHYPAVGEALETINVKDKDGHLLTKIARWQMTEWEKMLVKFETMRDEEPFELPNNEAEAEVDSMHPEEKPPATTAKKTAEEEA